MTKKLFNVYTYGSLEICFEYLKALAPFEDVAYRQALVGRFNKVPGVSLPANAIERRPGIPLSRLVDENALQQLISVLDWVVAELKKAGSMPPSPAGLAKVITPGDI